MNIGEQVRSAESWINARDLSERRLLSAVLIVVIASLWFTLLQRPALTALASTQAETQEKLRQAKVAQTTFEELRKAFEANPILTKRSRLQQLQGEVEGLNQRLAERAVNIISPQQMVAALRDLLDRQTGLTLVELENLPAAPAFSGSTTATSAVDGGNSADNQDNAPVVYRHGIRLALRGRYLAVLDYLEALEGLPWRFQWDDFRIEIEQYPEARAVIYLNTLSLGRHWIGT